jgi:hypothetical protein
VKEIEEINYLTRATYANAGCKFQPIKMCFRRRRRRRRKRRRKRRRRRRRRRRRKKKRRKRRKRKNIENRHSDNYI